MIAGSQKYRRIRFGHTELAGAEARLEMMPERDAFQIRIAIGDGHQWQAGGDFRKHCGYFRKGFDLLPRGFKDTIGSGNPGGIGLLTGSFKCQPDLRATDPGRIVAVSGGKRQGVHFSTQTAHLLRRKCPCHRGRAIAQPLIEGQLGPDDGRPHRPQCLVQIKTHCTYHSLLQRGPPAIRRSIGSPQHGGKVKLTPWGQGATPSESHIVTSYRLDSRPTA